MKQCGSPTPGGGNPKRSAFTLIELLGVIAIIAVLVLATIPAFDALRQRGLQAGMPQVVSALRLARQYAVTHRQAVWVVFPDDAPYVGTTRGEALKAMCSYAVIASNAATERFEYVSEWKFMPKGIYLDKEFGGGASSRNVLNSVGPEAFPFPTDTNSTTREMPAIQFRPNGKAYWHDGTIWKADEDVFVALNNALVNPDILSGLVTYKLLPTSVTNNNVIRVFCMTGQTDLRKSD